MTGLGGDDREGLRAQVLGGVRLTVDGREVLVRGPQRRLLVGLLLAETPRPISVQRIAEALRGGPSAAHDPANAVHAHLTRLRRLVDPAGERGRTWVRSGPEGYALLPDHLDLWDYEELRRQSQQLASSRPQEALRLAEAALRLWQPPWGELAATAPLAETVRRAELRHHSLQERWAALVVELGLGPEHADALVGLARAEPTREHRWALGMRALAQSGRQADALTLFDEARRTLADQLGIDPGEELRSTHQAVLRQDPEVARAARAAPAPLPSGGDPFVGRLDELSSLDGLVSRARVVTVTGLGGLGKSRLVTEWLASRGRGAGARWVDLRGAPADGVLTRVATELALTLSEENPEHVLEVVRSTLRDGPALLVLDNADLVSHDVAEVVARLVSEVPGLTVLVTSRQPLGLTEERVLTLGPLPVPGPGASPQGTATELAFERLGSQASDALAREIAEQSDGLPMVVEMMAARRRAGAAVRREPGDPQAPAHAAATDVLTRVVDEAVLYLSDEAEVLFRRAVHLPGGMSVDLASALVEGERADARALDASRARALRELVAGSLLVTTTSTRGVRYRALQPVVDARSAWVGHDDEVSAMRRLAAWMRSNTRATYLDAPDPDRLRRVVEEWINLDALLGWLEPHDPRELLELAIALTDVWDITGRGAEGHRWVQRGLAALGPDVDDVTRARALVSFHTSRGLAYVAAHGDEVEESRRLLAGAGAEGSELWGVVHAQVAVVEGWRGDLPAMERAVAVTQDVSVRCGSPWFGALATELDAMAWLPRGDPGRGVPRALEAARAFESLGDVDNAANATYFACVLARFAGAPDAEMAALLDLGAERAATAAMPKAAALIAGERARFGIARGLSDDADELAAALALTEQAGNLHHAAVGRRDLGLLLLREGRGAAARPYLREAVRHLLRLDHGACSLAVAGLASLHDGSARRTLATAAWTLARQAQGMPLTAADLALLGRLAGGEPTRRAEVAEVAAGVRDVLDLQVPVPSGPLCSAAPPEGVSSKPRPEPDAVRKSASEN